MDSQSSRAKNRKQALLWVKMTNSVSLNLEKLFIQGALQRATCYPTEVAPPQLLCCAFRGTQLSAPIQLHHLITAAESNALDYTTAQYFNAGFCTKLGQFASKLRI